MGFFSSLFSSGSKTKETSNTTLDRDTTLNQNQTQTANESQTTSGKTTSDSTQTSKTSQLSDGVIKGLENLVLNATNDPNNKEATAAAGTLAKLLAERAEGADAGFSSLIAAPIAEARRIGEREIKGLESNLAAAAGGSRVGNSFVAGATAEGRAALESQLAAQEATAALQARGLASQEIQQALAGQATGANVGTGNLASIAQLVYALKGAETTTQTQASQTEVTQQEQIRQLLEQLVGTTTETTKEKGSGTATSNTKNNDGGLLGKILVGKILAGASSRGG